MGRVGNILVTQGGRYYTTAPTIQIDPPAGSLPWNLDSDHGHSYAISAVRMDSQDVINVGTITDNINDVSTFAMLSFWYWLDSVEPATLIWNEKFRIFVGNNQKLGIAAVVDSSRKDAAQTDNVIVRDTSTTFVQKNTWQHAQIETYGYSGLKIGIDNQNPGTYATHFNDGDNYLYDSGDIIRIGYDSGYTGPQHKENFGGQYRYDSDINKGFSGYLNYFEFTVDSTRSPAQYDNADQQNPDSAEQTYRGLVPMIQETFDYGTATATSTIDSFGAVSKITITDSGRGYEGIPNVSIIGGHVVDSDFNIGDTVEQTLSSGVKVSGEIQRIILDSAGDSTQCFFLAHVGADDGKYHSFVSNTDILPPFTTGTLINKTNNTSNGLIIRSVKEDNKISETEQNETFSTISDDFLDFSEDNPFGDPENQ